jgi:hypothetical protein
MQADNNRPQPLSAPISHPLSVYADADSISKNHYSHIQRLLLTEYVCHFYIIYYIYL